MAGLRQRNQIRRLQRRESAGSGRKKLNMKICNICDNKQRCPFYEKDSIECVYEVLAKSAECEKEKMYECFQNN